MKTLSIFLGLLFATNIIVAQTNYYTESKIFKENGYTYKADVSLFIKLYNMNNKWTYQQPRYKDTGDILEEENLRIELSVDDSWNKAESFCDSIMRVEFGSEIIEKIKKENKGITITIFVNSETGVVEEVKFSFIKDSPFVYIPVSTYRKIELAIKENVRLSVTKDESLLTFILYWMRFKF